MATANQCSLLLFVATSTEEEALAQEAAELHLSFQRVRDQSIGDFYWMGNVGNESVIAIPPARERGRAVMGHLGRLGSAARAIQFRQETGAQSIIQIGMAFGIDPGRQNLGDVLVSSSLIPYDSREIRPVPRNWRDRLLRRPDAYVVDYSSASRQVARLPLVELFRREQNRGGHDFRIHVGAILSGAAQIRSTRFRDELVVGVPAGADVIGGEMEGVGLLAASTAADDPIWCVVKGISDFADRNPDDNERRIACRNAARFVLSALVRDARTR